jgi:SOUL heme-binding protein
MLWNSEPACVNLACHRNIGVPVPTRTLTRDAEANGGARWADSDRTPFPENRTSRGRAIVLTLYATLILLALLGAPLFADRAAATEEPPHTVVVSDGDFEIRDYPPLTIAEVTVRANRNDAAYAGFRKLAGYIFGGNADKQKIAMTAPVIEARGAGGGGEAEEGWTIRFVMPQGSTIAKLPKPNDPAIRMRETTATRYAALRYSGLAGDATVEAKTQELNAILKRRGLEPAGPPLLAFYDPPWTLWFMRRNEILTPLK